MRKKVMRAASELASSISKWHGVEAVVLSEAAESDVLDPYFALVLDVYADSSLPAVETRKIAYGAVDAFETSGPREKDRFLLGGIPVRIESKQVSRVEEFVTAPLDAVPMLKDVGTYRFYRLERGQAMFERSDWLGRMRTKLAHFPARFWMAMRELHQAKMDHSVGDLGAAAMSGDRFFYSVSAAGFLSNAAATLFMLNRRFEPSRRHMTEQLASLPLLPEGFLGRWETFLRDDGGMPASRRYEVAQLLARSIMGIQASG